MENLFHKLISAVGEDDVTSALEAEDLQAASWRPLAGNENNFGVIENQQASPVAALIEKVTNSIDALLMRYCLEAGIDPRSEAAPKTMFAAVEKFFPATHKCWHLLDIRRKQAASIQIVASGSRTSPSLLIYDDGEGQHPDKFEDTFLSLLRGNKNEVPFVQGKYNMGGTGAIVFCGKHRYQLIASKRFDATGNLGFTLIRKHQLSEAEKKVKKSTWYEYLKINGEIPCFASGELDVGLAGRKFITGTLLKLYDYDLPAGVRGALPQEPRRAIDQYLFEPALPIYLVDSKERYPNNKVLEMDCFGLKRRLETDENRYVEEHFTEEAVEHDIGRMKATCYVFKAKIDGRTVKETRDILAREFFHDNMAVLFSLNGQVHGHFTPEFITRTLKMPLLKNHLLIHIDCTGLDYDFRAELFMASRDRLKGGDETSKLRKRVANLLVGGRLTEIYKERKNAISIEGGDAKDLLRAFSKTLPFNKDLMKLLHQTFKIEQHGENTAKPEKSDKTKLVKEKKPFHPKRYPSFFSMQTGKSEPLVSIPEGNHKTLRFLTDVENEYFDRTEDPGELQISILQYRHAESEGSTDQVGSPRVDKLLDVRKSSPKDGIIRVGLGATSELSVGDEMEVQAVLAGPQDFECRFWIKIVKAEENNQLVSKPDEEAYPPLGLPDYVLVYHEAPMENPDLMTWAKLAEADVAMDWDVVMHPYVGEEGQLEKLFINIDSKVLRNYLSRLGAVSIEQKELAEKKYISSVYFHTIFLFSITQNRKYQLKQGDKEIELDEYLRDVFSSYYSEFLLNFGTEQLIDSMAD